MNPIEISVVAPVYNEEAVLTAFLNDVLHTLQNHFKNFEIIIVDDGSTDRTLEIALDYANKNLGIRVLSFARNYGHEIALTAGIEHAKGKYIVQMDADGQHPSALIPELYQKIQQGFDIVYGARKTHQRNSIVKKLFSKFFYYIAKKMTGFSIPENASNFRIINCKVANAIKKHKESNRHLIMLYAYLGYRTASVDFDVQHRIAGETKYSYRKLFNLAIDSIISFSNQPLRIMSAISMLISIVLAFYAGFIVIQRLFWEQNLAAGVASVIFITSCLFAILFLFLALISEYIGRILVESKNRPLYHIKESYGFEHHTDN